MGRKKQSRPVKRRRVILEADDSVVAEEQTTLMEHQHHENQGGVEGEDEMARAIELLRKTPSHQVEAAAAEATRLDLGRKDRWIHLRPPKIPSSRSSTKTTTFAIAFKECASNEETQVSSNQTRNDDRLTLKNNLQANASTGSDKATPDTVDNASANTASSGAVLLSYIPPWARGLGFARLGIEDFEALQELHQLIKNRVNRRSEKNNDSSSSDLQWASWSGSIEDPRKRAFGFLPGTWVSSHSWNMDTIAWKMPFVSCLLHIWHCMDCKPFLSRLTNSKPLPNIRDTILKYVMIDLISQCRKVMRMMRYETANEYGTNGLCWCWKSPRCQKV